MSRSYLKRALTILNAMEVDRDFSHTRAAEIRAALENVLLQHRVRPRVLLDVDGVCADTVGAIMPHVNRILATDYDHRDVTTYKIEQAFNLNADQQVALRMAWCTRGFCQTIPVYPGVGVGVEALQAVSDVYAVTAPFGGNETWTHERDHWLYNHLSLTQHKIIHTSAKYTVDGDFLIEDNMDNLKAWLEAHPDGVGILWDQPYNQDPIGHRAHPRVHRVSSWPEVIDLVKRWVP